MPVSAQMNRASESRNRRQLAVDAMRGIVMILMTVDHASYAFNANRYVADSIVMVTPGSAIPAGQFLLRWMTHICAPTFVFLAGLALAFSIARKQGSPAAEKRIDADLVIRGVFLMALDPLWMSLGFGGQTVFQVLYAIGGGFCCMVLLRRLGQGTLLAVALGLLIGAEALAGLALWLGDGQRSGPLGVLLATGGRLGPVFVLYPLIPWLAYMSLGLWCGRRLQRGAIERPTRWFAAAGFILLGAFVVIRALNGYGNMLLYRDDGAFLQWLRVSKYPPSLTFALLTLGMMGGIMALLYKLYPNARLSTRDPLLVFGRAPLLFYLLHVHLLSGSAVLLGLWKTAGLAETVLSTAAVLVMLYPLCRWYTGYKQTHSNRILRLI
jgi:uncharacterized membrane protein